VAAVQAARVSKGFGNDLSRADAECATGNVVQALPQVLGQVVGTAAFTNPALQQRFGVTSPAWGVLFAKLMVDSGATLPAQFGAHPLYEADFVAVVKDAALADVPTPLEALQPLAVVVPFIELAEVMLDGTPTGTAIICRQHCVTERRPWSPCPGRADAGVPGGAGHDDSRDDRGHEWPRAGLRPRERAHGTSNQCHAVGCPGAQKGWGSAQAGGSPESGRLYAPSPDA
jgi:hypothetical protein